MIELRKAMLELKMTTGELAALLGISRPTVARRLAGKSKWKRLEQERIDMLIQAAKNKTSCEQTIGV